MSQPPTEQDIWWLVQAIKYWSDLIPAVQILILLIGIDIGMGILAAVSKRTLNSTTSFSGMCKKCGILLFVTMGAVLERLSGQPLTLLFAAAFAFQEIVSITENMVVLGVPVPQSIIDILEKIHSGKKDKLEQKSRGNTQMEKHTEATDHNTDALNRRSDQVSSHVAMPVIIVSTPEQSIIVTPTDPPL